jgi:hypothetical protein
MRFLLALLVCSCVAPVTPPPIAPKPPVNFADEYVASVDPKAKRLPWGDDTVLVRKDAQVFVCVASTKYQVACQVIADWTPKPPVPAPVPLNPEPGAPTATQAAKPPQMIPVKAPKK